MEFRDLKQQYKMLKGEIDEKINDVIENAHFISGSQIGELELQLSQYVGVKHCITCANGTDALSIALMSWDIGPGDAVFVPDFTFFSTAEVVAFCGATPIFVDVDYKTCNLDCNSLQCAIKEILEQGTLNPKVIIPVDLFGQPAEMLKIKEIALKYDLKLLEDGAQGFGGRIRDKKACSFGDISTTSFFPAKPLGCYGDGGAIFTNDDELATQIRSLCIHGKGGYKYDNVRIGVNSRLDTIQAAILQTKLKAFQDYELTAVNEIAQYYSEGLQGFVETPTILEEFYSSWAQYVIKLSDEQIRNELQSYLKDREIPTMIYYPKTLHSQKAFSYLKTDNDKLQNSERLTKTVLALPIHPYMKHETADIVIDAVRKFIG